MVISKIASVLPDEIIDNTSIASICGSDEKFLSEKVGIESRRFLSSHESVTSLAANACRKLFEHVNPSDIGLCIWIGQVKDQIIPHASALLQAALELPQNCICFDLGLACSGYVYALAIADSLISTGLADKALLVTCDPYSLIMDRTDRSTAPLFGDAATATLLSSSGPGIEIARSDMGTDGRGAKYLECSPHTGQKLHMDGKGIFNFAVRQVPLSVNRCLALNNVVASDIDYFIFHQANAFILEKLCVVMGIPPVKCPIMMRDVANTVSSSIPLVLESLELKHGAKIILSSFGGGLSWGTTLGRCVLY